ncbi:Retrovirus-related Pol polyprotein from transposon RE2 [Vitis vinifera]|uniref:Retrovirus-related Pol polyprotein from transposon RE2 n=1 Tax=Vitis vinifera TaxID=29760 RepID=A0A438K833_VITVI|nr:Retrovirus-related Pol polyprotein from transposon RE2 [Vitis vinifera]
MATKSSTFSSVISGSPMITSEKLVGSENYLSWSASVELWFMGQGYEDHLVTQEADIPEAKGLYKNDIQRLYKVTSSIINVRQQDMDLSTYIGQIVSLKEEFLIVMPLTTDVGDQRTQIDKFFVVLTLIGFRPDLETVRDQILGSSSVPSLNDVFARLLRISSTQTLPSNNTSDSSVLVSQTSSRGGRSVTWATSPHCHVAQSYDPQSPQPPSSSTSQGISLTDSEYDDYLRYQATKSTSVASVAQTGNVSACLTHTSSLGPWILDSGASDHIAGNKDLFSSITTTSALPTVTLANSSQTMAKGFGFAHPLPSLPLHSVLYAPECPFNLISISKITRTLNCFITFSDKFVTLQDRSTGKTIGIGRESQGLYHLIAPSTPVVCISTDAPILIHSRLGHPSLSKFQKMDKLSARATKCNFLGYSRLQKGYRCYSSEIHRYFLSADVTFFENSPFFSTSESLPVSEVLLLPIISPPDAVSSRPLQVYHRRHRVAVPPSLAEVPIDSLPIPSASPAPALPPSADLPIALRKSTPEALSHPGWRQTMIDEMTALHSNGTWDLVVLPSGKFTIGCRWVYTVKVGPDGQVDRLKVRLVAKGYTQVYGSDYGDTLSPVAKIAFVRLLLSMAVMRSWPLYQLDIKNVFLHGDLAEEVYMEQLPGFVTQGESGLVCRLRRSLYGLKQSPRAWFSRFSSIVQEFGMFRNTADHSVFYHHNSSGQCIYLIKDLGKLKYFLGIEIAQSSSGVVLSQRKTREPLGDPGRYQRLVGKLNYLTITRPDISFPVSVVSQFLQSPCDSHWDAVIRILRYIKSTPGQGVLYENRGHTQVVGYTDADWASSPQIDVPLPGVKYGQEGCGWRTKDVCGPYGVGLWKEIMKEVDWCWESIVFKVGKGTKILFWTDKWCGNEALSQIFPQLYTLAGHRIAKVSEVWDYSLGQGGWNLRLARDFNDWELEQIGNMLNLLKDFRTSTE